VFVVASRWARVVRGTLVAAFAVFVAMFSHVAAGGSAPGMPGLAIALAFGVMVSVAVAGRRLTLPRLAVSVGLSQVLLHALFSVGSGGSVLGASGGVVGATMTSHGDHSGHSGMAALLASGDAGASTAGSGAVTAMGMSHADGGMWLAHALAAVVTIAVLWRAERAIWGMLTAGAERLVAVLVGAFVGVPIRATGISVAVVADALRSVRDDLGVVLSTLRHRGPPAFATSS
jgi:hypothetical protein